MAATGQRFECCLRATSSSQLLISCARAGCRNLSGTNDLNRGRRSAAKHPALGVHSTGSITPHRFDHREELPMRRARPNRLNAKATRKGSTRLNGSALRNGKAAKKGESPRNGSVNGSSNHHNDFDSEPEFGIAEDSPLEDEVIYVIVEGEDDLEHLPEEGSSESHIDDPIRM